MDRLGGLELAAGDGVRFPPVPQHVPPISLQTRANSSSIPISPVNYLTYKIIHLIGIAALAIGIGGMLAGGEKRKTFVILQGVALLVMLVSGFGLLAKLGLGFPHFAIVKVVLWLVIGMLPMIFRRLRVPLAAGVCVFLTLVGILAWLGISKPALW